MDIHRIFASRLWIAIAGAGGFVALLILAPRLGQQADLVRTGGLIWFFFFGALALGAPAKDGLRSREVSRRFTRRA